MDEQYAMLVNRQVVVMPLLPMAMMAMNSSISTGDGVVLAMDTLHYLS